MVWVALILYAASLIYQVLTQPRIKNSGATGSFTAPTNDSGRVIPICFGTCRIEGNYLWFGPVRNQPYSPRVGEFELLNLIRLDYGLCLGPIDALVGLYWADRQIAGLTGAPSFPISGPDETLFSLDLPGFLGTGTEEGRLRGNIRFYFGTQDQTPNESMEAELGIDLPAYPGLCHLVLEGGPNMPGFCVGTSGSLDAIAAVVRSCPNGLGLVHGEENISGDANPACMIYKLLTMKGPNAGLWVSPSMIDAASFKAVAQVLAAEHFGLSMLIDASHDGGEWIAEICRHIDAVVFTNLFTGLITIRLVRFDYNPDDLPVLDESCFESVELTRLAPSQTFNVVRVKFTNRALDFKEDFLPSHDIANQAMQGGAWAVSDLEFPAISNSDLATRVAHRERQGLSYPFAKLAGIGNRRAWSLQPGEVFRLTWPPLGISLMAVRVSKVASGTLTDGKMRIEMIEDIFSVGWTGFTPPPPGPGPNPSITPAHAPIAQAFHQTPYELARSVYEPGRLPRGMAMIARDPRDLVTDVIVHRQLGGSWSMEPAKHGATPLGVIPTGQAISPADEEITIQASVDMFAVQFDSGDRSPDGYFLAILVPPEDQTPTSQGKNSEIVAYQTVTQPSTGIYVLSNIRRGALDTVPRALPEGTQVWFLSYGYSLIAGDRPSASNSPTGLTVKLAPANSKGEYADWAGEPAETLSFAYSDPDRNDQREDLAYAPTLLHVNGLIAPENISGSLLIHWLHRNRLGVWSLGNWGATAGIEPGWCYHIYIYSETDALIYSNENLDDNFFNWTLADEIAASGLGRANSHLRIVVETALPRTGGPDVLHAWQAIEREFDCSGWGMLYGCYYGGTDGLA